MTITVETPIKRSGRVQQIEGMFDVPPSEKQAQSWAPPQDLLDIAADADGVRPWNIGLIVGPSGSGKSTVARNLWGGVYIGPDEWQWSRDRAVVDCIDGEGVKDVTGLLTSVGFGSPPAWLRPYHVLSTGEQFRCDLARTLASQRDPLVVDEFTSVVDRRVAQIGSAAVSKTVRRRGQRLVAVTCHFDVLDWLQPDWVYRPDSNDFEWRRLQPRPTLDFEIASVGREAWDLFRHHHYLSADLHVAAKCVCAFHDGQPVAFNAYYRFPHPRAKDIMVSHRTVVLPDFQGLGLGGRLSEFVGQMLWEKGRDRYRATLAHPALIAHRLKSPRWRLQAGQNKPSRSAKPKRLQGQHASSRKLTTKTFEYVPVT